MIDRRLVLILLCLPLVACGPGKEGGNNASGVKTASSPANAGRPQTVQTTLTRAESIPLILETQGNIISLDEVDIKPQKTGIISQIHFKEGDEVKKGKALFSLDSRDDEANVKKAEARVTGSRAQLEIAKRDYQRAQELVAKNYISPASLDTTKSKLDAADSTLAQDQAALESAKIILSYDHIVAPFSGRAGRIDVRPGSLVLANSTVSLVKITRIDPIGISFTLPERNLPDLMAAQKSGEVKIRVDLADKKSLTGKVVFFENAVDRTSGSIGIKAKISNDGRQLWPGQFVPVKVLAGEIKDAVTLPAQAIQSNTNGRFVYVVMPDKTVKAQPIELVQIMQQRAIITGIAGGVKVVLEGGQNLRPGGKVNEASAPAEARRGKRDGSKPASAVKAA